MAVDRPPGSRRVLLHVEGERQHRSLGYVTNRGRDLINLLRQWADREEQHLAASTADTPPEPAPEEDR